VPSSSSSAGLGAFFRHIGTKRICAGRLSYTAWTLQVSAPGFERAATAQLAQAYVGLTGSWVHPHAAIAVELPTQDTTRKGDFGELIAAALFSHRLGYDVPFQKLELMRPVATATVHGPDIMAFDVGTRTGTRARAGREQTPAGDLPQGGARRDPDVTWADRPRLHRLSLARRAPCHAHAPCQR
jgi:hypothetical protein